MPPFYGIKVQKNDKSVTASSYVSFAPEPMHIRRRKKFIM